MTTKRNTSTVPAPAAAPAAPSGTSLDSLFGRNVEPDKSAPTIDREHLKAGAVVRHRGTRRVQTQNGASVIHSFSLCVPDGDGPWFSLWGSANLNSQISKTKPSSILLLRYAGQEQNPDGSAGTHLWEVKPSTASAETIRTYLSRDVQREQARDLVAVIERAQEADRERRNARKGGPDDGAPPHDDSDIPF